MKKDQHNLKDENAANASSNMKRRNFFKLLGGGIYIFFTAWDPFELLAAPPAQRRPLPKDFNAFLRIAEDGSVSGFTGKIEMGQGPITSLAQELAEELDVSVSRVTMVMGDTDLCPWDMGTFGSMTTRFFGPPFRAAAAEARAVLLQLGSEKLGVSAEYLEVHDGIINVTTEPGKKVTYAELAEGKRIERFIDQKPPVKNASQYKVIGTSQLRKDSMLKVTGQAKYSGDIHPEGMVFASILRSPSHGAKLQKVDTSEAEKIPGVTVIRENELVAVLHESLETAEMAVRKIKAEYSFNEKVVNDKTIFNYLLEKAPTGNMVHKTGDLSSGKASSKINLESTFLNSYVAHSPMEPHTAVAFMEGDRVIVHGSTQTPFPAQENIARTLGLPNEKVRVIPPFLGGGFGGKSEHLQMIEAARLAKLSGKPVMVAWTRQEEFFNDTFRPAAVVKINSGIDEKGKIQYWDFHVYYAGARGSETIYDVLNANTTSYGDGWTAPDVHPFGTGAWRAPGNNTNTFARESQIDMMAANAGIDPLQFRLMNLRDAKMIEVLKTAADKFGWKPAKGPSGRGYGISCGIDAGTSVVNIAEVKVDVKTGEVKVVRVVSAQNMGLCINPEGATIQMEGCITMGMGYALTEEIQFEGGKILNRNFDTYEIPRFSWLPKIETYILDKPDEPPQGGGEPAIINMGACLANAIFDATGARLMQLPMTPERVLEAIKKVKTT